MKRSKGNLRPNNKRATDASRDLRGHFTSILILFVIKLGWADWNRVMSLDFLIRLLHPDDFEGSEF